MNRVFKYLVISLVFIFSAPVFAQDCEPNVFGESDKIMRDNTCIDFLENLSHITLTKDMGTWIQATASHNKVVFHEGCENSTSIPINVSNGEVLYFLFPKNEILNETNES